MPIHDWTRVDAGIFHHFHQRWVGVITDVLNRRLLPREYYALAERQGAGFEPDILTLKASESPEPGDPAGPPEVRSSGQAGEDGAAGGGLLVAEPRVRVTAETDLEFYRRKQNVVAVRHASGDRLVAVVEVVSRGNKSGRKAFEDFVRKAAELLESPGPPADPRPAAADLARSPRDSWRDLGRGRRSSSTTGPMTSP